MSKQNCKPSKPVSQAGKALGSDNSSKAQKSAAGRTLVNHKNNKH